MCMHLIIKGLWWYIFRLSWECLPQTEGEEFVYTVQVKREPSPNKSKGKTLEVGF